jgi:hypothetical protein
MIFAVVFACNAFVCDDWYIGPFPSIQECWERAGKAPLEGGPWDRIMMVCERRGD